MLVLCEGVSVGNDSYPDDNIEEWRTAVTQAGPGCRWRGC